MCVNAQKGGLTMKILDKIAKLIDVKSFLSLGVLAVFVYLALNGSLESKDVMVIITVVFTFFFSYQNNKKVE